MNRIKLLREELNMTQQDLANRLECSKSVIGLYENETRKPSMEVLLKLSEIFDCSIDYILCKSDIRNTEELKQEDFRFAFHKETEGLSEDEIKEALEFYKLVKNRKNKENKQ